jgi:hypothetical protein
MGSFNPDRILGRDVGSSLGAGPVLRSSPAALTATAWSPSADLTVSDWARQGRWLGALGRGSGWWIGDWLRYGNARYGDRYGPAAQVTGYDVQSLRNMSYVAGRFEVPRRRAGLSFSHHAVLASLLLEDQELWLDRAEAGGLSVNLLRVELRRVRDRGASRGNVAAAPAQRRSGIAAARLNTRPRTPDVQPSRVAQRPTNFSSAATPSGASTREVICPDCGHQFVPSLSSSSEAVDDRGQPSGRHPTRQRAPFVLTGLPLVLLLQPYGTM